MVSCGRGILSMDVFTWFTIVGLDGTEYMEFLDFCQPGLFNSRISVLRLVVFSFNGSRQILDTGHRHNLNTSAYGVSILEVLPSYILT